MELDPTLQGTPGQIEISRGQDVWVETFDGVVANRRSWVQVPPTRCGNWPASNAALAEVGTGTLTSAERNVTVAPRMRCPCISIQAAKSTSSLPSPGPTASGPCCWRRSSTPTWGSGRSLTWTTVSTRRVSTSRPRSSRMAGRPALFRWPQTVPAAFPTGGARRDRQRGAGCHLRVIGIGRSQDARVETFTGVVGRS